MLHPKERLSQQELQRRYNAVRAKMKERGLEVLIVSGIRFVAGAGYLRYLTNWAEPFGGEVLVFPYEGTPTFLARTAERALIVQNLLGLQATAGSTAAHAADVLRKRGYKQVGLCGLQTMLAEFYVQLTGAMRDIEFIEASSILDEVRMFKSEEELEWVKKSANLTDVAFQVFSSLVRTGRSEAAGPGGYYTQLERTLSLGKPPKEAEAAYAVCINALEAGASLLRPGQRATGVFLGVLGVVEEAGGERGRR